MSSGVLDSLITHLVLGRHADVPPLRGGSLIVLLLRALRVFILFLLASPIAYSFALIGQTGAILGQDGAARQDRSRPSKGQTLQAQQAPNNISRMAIGEFPVLSGDIDRWIRQLQPAIDQGVAVDGNKAYAGLRESLLRGRSRPRLVMLTRKDDQITNRYDRLCDTLSLDCVILRLTETQRPPAGGIVSSIPLLTAPIETIRQFTESASSEDIAGIYIFDVNGRLVWHSSFAYIGGVVDAVVRTLLSARSSDPGEVHSVPDDRTMEEDLREELETTASPAGTELDIRAGNDDEKDSPDLSTTKDGRAENVDAQRDTLEVEIVNVPEVPLSVTGLGSIVWAVESPDKSIRFSQSWAVRHALQKKRPLLLIFWATWCHPCITEMPDIGALSKRYPDVLFVGLVDDPNRADIREMVINLTRKEGLRAQYITKDLSIARAVFGQRDVALPAFALFDSAGRLTATKFIGSIKVEKSNFDALTTGLDAITAASKSD